MHSRPTTPSADGRRAPRGPLRAAWPLGPVWIVLLALLAYRALWMDALSTDLDEALFRPGAVPALLVVAVAAFVLGMRWTRLRALPGPGAPIPAALVAAVGSGLLVWSELTGATALLLPSLAANGLAVAVLTRGRAGARVAALPALVLLLGVPLPRPIEDEVLWQLQRATAVGAGWGLDVVGRGLVQSGVMLRSETHAFHVIDGCSGLGGITILTLVALVVRALFADAGARVWLLLALAPPLGFALNVLRVAYVAASPNPEALAGIEGDHTPQGLVVLMTGTAILYAAGWALARGSGVGAHERVGTPDRVPTASRVAIGAGLALLALLSWTLPSFSEQAGDAGGPGRLPVPAEKGGWTSRPAPSEHLFNGQLSGGVHRRYEWAAGPGTVVDLLVGFEGADAAGTFRLLSSKLAFPGPDWDLTQRRREKIWLLDREVTFALASRGEEVAVVYAWRLRDAGLWREAWRAALALDAGPFRRARPRAAVRLVAYAPHDGQLVVDRARQRLDRFVSDFREELNAL